MRDFYRFYRGFPRRVDARRAFAETVKFDDFGASGRLIVNSSFKGIPQGW